MERNQVKSILFGAILAAAPIGLDPATSSAPFVATLVDVTGLVIYFTVALVILRGVELQTPIIVEVNQAGVLIVNGEEAPFDEFEERMAAVVEKYERRPVQFRADSTLIPEKLLEIYEVMTKVGVSKLELRSLPKSE
jgi:biopolymer transport protein ExbD